MQPTRRIKFRGKREVAAVLLLALFCSALMVLSLPRIQNYFVDRTHSDHAATLRLVAGGLDQALRRFAPLPELISDTPEFKQVLKDPSNQGLVPFMNAKLRLTALSVGASDVYLMDNTGLTVASSNYREEHSFIGQDFSFRPYFQDAATGESAFFHALGTTSGQPGFFFAAPVLDGIDVIGVLAVKVSTNPIENGWAAEGREIIVADQNGIVFMTSDPDLRYRTLAPISDGARNRIRETRQFPLDLVVPLAASTDLIKPGSVRIQFTDALNNENYLADSAAIALPGWHVVIISPMSAIARQSLYVLAFGILGVLVLTLAALLLVQRRARQVEMVRSEQAQRMQLEHKVTERTAELRDANAKLTTEVKERKSAEERLRGAQRELVQAGKLAALGHMSAALSHEINQPLTAVKSYASNAVAFLEREQVDKAQANLAYISKLADRMAAISSHLRNFARRPGDQLSSVPIVKVINDAIDLIEPLAAAQEAEIKFTPVSEPIFAIGGPLRLQQVIVNLLSNAIDAMEGSTRRKIEVSVDTKIDTVDIVVRDYGPGLLDGTEEQVFEPFYTTKRTGEGMGLGLSISFNIVEDFGGKLSAHNHSEVGAIFRIRLLRTVANADVSLPLVAE